MKLIPAMKAQGIYDTVVNGLNVLTKGTSKTTEDVLDHLTLWKVMTNSRPTSRLGQCRYRAREIELHSVLMKAEHKSERDRTFLHEVAHAVARFVFNESRHGAAWQRTMRAFGQAPKAAVESKAMGEHRKKKANYVYACTKCGVEHHALRRKKRPAYDYTHTGCGGKLYIKSFKKGKSISMGDKMFREQLRKEGKL